MTTTRNLMKTILYIFLFSLPFIGVAQNDTLIINNNYKWKVGVKGLFEKSGIPVLAPIETNVYNFGASLVYKLGTSKSSIESGVFSLNRKFNIIDENVQRNIQIPFKYRLETKIIYLNIGIYGSYLLYKNVGSFVGGSDRKFNLGYTGALGIEKNISKQFSIFVEAEFSTDLTSASNKNSFFDFGVSTPYYENYGFSIGVNYKVSKK